MDPITPATTIAELLLSRPEARDALRARGIDTCCGGALSLGDAAELRGIDLAELLAAVAPAVSIGAGDSVRAVLARYPGTVRVFEKHGLTGCGGSAGPDERIDLFAIVHHIDVTALLAELNDAALRPVEPAAAVPSAPPPDVFRPFIAAALWSTLTLGATFGAYNLLAIHLALGVVPPAHTWAHAGAQLWGFVLLFVMGVSYHALPRFLGTELARPAIARATFHLALSGLVLTTYGRFGSFLPMTAGSFLFGASLQLLAVLGWASLLFATWRRAHTKPEPFQRFLAAGTLWWLVAAILLFASAVGAFAGGDADLAAAWNQSIYAAVLFGGVLSWIAGMFLRVGPVFLELGRTRDRLVTLSLTLIQIGATLGTFGLATARARIADLGLIATALAVASFAAAVRPWSGGPSRLPGADPAFRPMIRASFGFALLFAALGSWYGIVDAANGSGERLLYDGARHAFALGFVTLMIFAMAGRILPVFAGAELRHRAAYGLGGTLIAIGVLMREAQVLVVVLKDARLMNVSGVSGVVAALGVALASISLLATLRASARATREPAVPAHTLPIDPGTNVAALVASHPEALPILIEAGFTPLANPVLRRTLARAVTLGQAGRMHAIDVDAILRRVRAACPQLHATP